MITKKSSITILDNGAHVHLRFSNTWGATIVIPVHSDKYTVATGLRELAVLIENGQSDAEHPPQTELTKQEKDVRTILFAATQSNISVTSAMRMFEQYGNDLPKLSVVQCRSVAMTHPFSIRDIEQWFLEDSE